MAATEVLHQPPSLRVLSVAALPQMEDAIPPESYHWIAESILLRTPGEETSVNVRSILDCVIKNDNTTALSILMLNPDFDMDYLIEQLPETADQGRVNIIRMMLLKIFENPDLVKNPTDLLGTMLIKEAEAGQLEVVQTLMDTDAYNAMPTIYLDLAMILASEKGQFEVVQTFVENHRFNDFHSASLSIASSYASQADRGDIVETFRRCNRAHEIRAVVDLHFLLVHLGLLFMDSSREGQLGAVEVIIGHNQFGEMNIDHLSLALALAANERQFEVVLAFIRCRRFADILPASLGEMLINAAERGRLDVIQTPSDLVDFLKSALILLR